MINTAEWLLKVKYRVSQKKNIVSQKKTFSINYMNFALVTLKLEMASIFCGCYEGYFLGKGKGWGGEGPEGE